jgi:TPR repeat protein
MVRPSLCAALLGLALGLAQFHPAAAGPREGVSAYAHHDYQRAFRILLPLAVRGDSEAQTFVGLMFAQGQGVPKNFVAAAAWYHRASAQGYPYAQFLLGLMYDKGHGVPQNAVLAYKWLDLAVAGAGERDRPDWVRIRDAVGSKLSLAELDDAQQLALQWRPRQGH